MKYPEYAGMSYEQASRAALAVIDRYGWFRGFDRLHELHTIMNRCVARAA